MKIAPSVLNAPYRHLEQTFKDLKNAYMIHLDIMDGHFVPNLSFGVHIAKEMSTMTSLPLDVHLMVTHPLQHIPAFAELSPQYVTVHVEAKDVDKSIDMIKASHIGAGISVKPHTPIEMIMPYIDKVDLVLVMTVEPGFGGQSFMADMLHKVKTLKPYQKKHDFIIEVDGGVNDETLAMCVAAGVDVAVVGSHLFKQKDMNAWLKHAQ